MADNYNTRSGALWVQPNGSNNPTYFLGCHDLDDISEPLSGGVTPVRKFNPNGSGWITTGRNVAVPDPISTTITGLLFKQKDWLEKLNCPFTLFVMMRCGGPANIFANWERGYAIRNCVPITRTLAGLVAREEEAESTVALEISGDVPLVFIDPMVVDRLSHAETLDGNGLWVNQISTCRSSCTEQVEAGDLLYLVNDSAAGPATANAYYSDDAGATITAFAVDPLGAGVSVFAVTSFMIGKTTRRILVSGGIAGGQGQVAYSDDNGASWTAVNLGGAAANHAATKGSGLFALDKFHVWLATNGGYIYKSVDGGETWTAVESGTITVNPYQAIHFSDELNGVAVSAADVIVTTSDGGDTWTQQNATGGGAALLSAYRLDDARIWVGDAADGLWFTSDNGDTWTQRTGWASKGAAIRDIEFAPGSDLIGFLSSATAGPVATIFRTVDGGNTWDELSTPTNAGINDLVVATESLVYAIGDDAGGSCVLLKAHV